jgi:hypothetical protein
LPDICGSGTSRAFCVRYSAEIPGVSGAATARTHRVGEADLFEELLKRHEDRPIIDIKEHRAKLLAIVSELLLHPDQESETEPKSESDSFTNAVNSLNRSESWRNLHRTECMAASRPTSLRVNLDGLTMSVTCRGMQTRPGVSYFAQTPHGKRCNPIIIETPSQSVRSSIQLAEPEPTRVSKELCALAQEVATEAAEPIKTGVSKAFNRAA